MASLLRRSYRAVLDGAPARVPDLVHAAVRERGRCPARPDRNPLNYNDIMALTTEEVQHIAKLARLELTDEQREHYREQLSHILDYIAKLRTLDTTDVPPTAGGGLTQMALRPDGSRPSLPTDVLLENAPEVDDDQFKIPPVFE